ncbi:MAG: hypothetical protein ACK518_04270 [bacterium]|jgi:twinkle protein
MSFKIKDGFDIADSKNSREDLLKYHKEGALRGIYLGFPVFHEKYTMSLPGCTDWTGIPSSGKTEYLLECLLNASEYYGWRHLLYVPDIGKKELAIAMLIHKISGKTFDKRFKNHITETEIEKHYDWVIDHFKIMYKTNAKAKITPYEFWDMAVEMDKESLKKEGRRIHTATIDSWKDMRRYVGASGESITRDDLYLEDVLEYRNTLSELHKMHFHTVIHPLKTETDKNGIRKAPTPYELKGGPTWYDMGKCQVTVHRIDGTQNEVDIIVTKAKPESVATVGPTRMFFDKKIRRFYWDYNGVDTYAKKEYFKPTGIAVSEQFDDDDSDIPF